MSRAQAMLLLALLPLLALAGCADESSTTREETPAEQALPSTTSTVDFDSCLGWIFVGRIPGPWVQERLPDGYVVYQGLSLQGTPVEIPGPAPLATSAYHCEGATLADGSHEEDVTFAITSVFLETAGQHDLPDQPDFYVFEVFVDVTAFPGVAAHFQTVGWPVLPATVEVGRGTFHIAAADVDYRLVLDDPTVDVDETMSDSERFDRYHVGGERASHGTFGDTEFRNFGTSFGARLEVTGGFFGAMRPSEAVPFAAGAAQGFGFDGPSVLQWAEP